MQSKRFFRAVRSGCDVGDTIKVKSGDQIELKSKGLM